MHIYTTRRKFSLVYLILALVLLSPGFVNFTNAAPVADNTISFTAEPADHKVLLRFVTTSDKKIDYDLFTLDAPPRLVIDFPKATYIENNINDSLKHCGFNRLRSFSDIEKVRFVLDTEYTTLPPFTQSARNQELLVTLKQADPESIKTIDNTPKSKKAGAVPFKSENNPISIDFKDTDIQNVFRFLAEINHLNVVMSDDVSGTVTLRLKEVPWKQVLSIVLKTHQLGMERTGNVVRIAPMDVFTNEQQTRDEKRRAEAESKKTEEDIQDTILKILKVNFASIDDVASKIENAILSDRGTVETDLRTNSLIITDIPNRIVQAEALLRELDEPVKQVMIEAKIVKIERKSAHELGVQWGGAWGKSSNDRYYGINGNNSMGGTGLPPVTDGGGIPAIPSSYAVNLPATAITSGIGLIFGKIDKYNLNLKLSAMQGQGIANILSSPKVLALNQHAARIGQGQEIPYQTTSQDGTTTEFKKAELSLEVTPTITNNGMVSMEVVVSKDSKGENTPDGPAINTQTITTSLLLKDGETAVVGGIIESNKTKLNQDVPVLGKIPMLGWLFRHNYKDSDQSELMIFITPRIIR